MHTHLKYMHFPSIFQEYCSILSSESQINNLMHVLDVMGSSKQVK